MHFRVRLCVCVIKRFFHYVSQFFLLIATDQGEDKNDQKCKNRIEEIKKKTVRGFSKDSLSLPVGENT